MDMSSLSTTLPPPKLTNANVYTPSNPTTNTNPSQPPPSSDPINKAFKEAALSLTNLYKQSQASRREGYLDALDDISRHFLAPSQFDELKLRTWIEERRRPGHTGGPGLDSAAATAAGLGPGTGSRRDGGCGLDDVEYIPKEDIFIDRSEAGDRECDTARDRDGARDRERERERDRGTVGIKRRVAVAEIWPSEFNKRGRFG